MTCETNPVTPPRTRFLGDDQTRSLNRDQASHELALICRQAATACSTYLTWARTQLDEPARVKLKGNHHDPVTVFDRAVEAAVAAVLGTFIPASYLVGEELGLSLLPGHGMIWHEDAWQLRHRDQDTPTQPGEAAVLGVLVPSLAAHPQVRSLGSRVRWIVDPIDGTSNFAAGMAYFGTSVACQVDGEVVAGAVHMPMLGATAWANAENGWWETTQGRYFKLDSTGPRTEKEAILVSYFPTSNDLTQYSSSWDRIVADLTGAFRAVRRPGACAVDLAQLAAGHVGAVFATHLKPWDLAAGLHLAKVSGARVLNSEIPTSPEQPVNDLALEASLTCGYGPQIAVSAAGLSTRSLDRAFEDVSRVNTEANL